MAGEIMQVVADHGVVGLVIFYALRSRFARAVSRCAATEIRWRYLRYKGVSSAELHRVLLEDTDDDPPATSG